MQHALVHHFRQLNLQRFEFILKIRLELLLHRVERGLELGRDVRVELFQFGVDLGFEELVDGLGRVVSQHLLVPRTASSLVFELLVNGR